MRSRNLLPVPFAAALLASVISCRAAEEPTPAQALRPPGAACAPALMPPAAPNMVHGASPSSCEAIAESAKTNGRKAAASDPMIVGGLKALNTPGWQREPLQVFLNSATGFGTISGTAVPVPGAQSAGILQEYGCTHAVVQTFRKPQRTVQLAIYTFVDDDGAFGAYSVLRKGSSTVVTRGDASSEDDSSVSFWKGHRFVVATSRNDDDEISKGLVSSLCDQLAPMINDRGTLPAELSVLPGLERLSGSERYLMGTTALRHYSVPHAQLLQLEKSQGAALAEYSFVAPPDRLKVLVVEFPDWHLANAVFSSYTDAVSEGRKVRPLKPMGLLCKMSDSYLLCQQVRQRLILITGARHKESAFMMSGLLSR